MEKDLELIEKYLGDQLSEPEKEEIEERLRTDQVFAGRLELIREMKPALLSDVEGFKADLEDIIREKELEGSNQFEVPFQKKRFYLIAASVSIIAVCLILYKMLSPGQNLQDLYAENFSVPQENISVRNDEQLSPNTQNAIEAYDQQQYDKALGYFKSMLEENPGNEAAVFYSGICYMMLDQPRRAIAMFDQILSNQSSAYYSSAAWYKGLSLLKTNDAGPAKKVFKALSANTASSYAQKAEAILDHL